MKHTQDKRFFLSVFLPPAVWTALFFILPLSLIWLFSFGEKDGLIDINLVWTAENYLRALDPIYLQVFIKSVFVAGLATLICLLVGVPTAMMIVFSPPRWRPYLLLLIVLPFCTNLLIRTYALIAVLRMRGYLNFSLSWMHEQLHTVLSFVGLGGLADWVLGERYVPLELLYNNYAVVIGLVYVHLPFMVLPVYASLEKLDRSYIEASLDLGAGPFRTFRSVIVPLIMPGIISGIIITFIPSLGSYLTPDLLGGTDSTMIANIIERQFKSANDWPFGSALSFILMYITFGFLAIRAVMNKGEGRI